MFHKHFISSLWETCTYCLGGRKCILNYLSSYLGMIIYLRESLFYLAPIFAPLILLILVKLLIPQMDLDESHFTFMIGVPIIRLFRQRNLPIMVFISSMMPRQPRQARASTSSASVDTQAPNVVERNIWISDQGTIIYTMRAPRGRRNHITPPETARPCLTLYSPDYSSSENMHYPVLARIQLI